MPSPMHGSASVHSKIVRYPTVTMTLQSGYRLKKRMWDDPAHNRTSPHNMSAVFGFRRGIAPG